MRLRGNPSARANGEAGQGLVELAFVLPLMLTMALAVFDIGRVIWALDSAANAAREGARYAIVHGGSVTTACPVGPAGPEAIVPTASTSCPHPAPSKQSIIDAAIAAAVGTGNSVAVTVCYGSGCTGNTDATGADDRRGTSVTVKVTAQIGLVVPALLGQDAFTVSGSSTMLVNN